jgi:hypothetical protein
VDFSVLRAAIVDGVGMMVQTHGKVASLEIRQTPLSSTVLNAYVTVVRSPIDIGETITLWEMPVGECVPPSISIARSLNVTLLRDALVHRLDVIITHTDPVIVIDDQGGETEVSFVEAVRLLASAS